MLQTLDPISTLTHSLGAGLKQLERNHRWFIISALANRLLTGRSFLHIVDNLDPNALISAEVCDLLYELDGWTAQQVWLLQHAIVVELMNEISEF